MEAMVISSYCIVGKLTSHGQYGLKVFGRRRQSFVYRVLEMLVPDCVRHLVVS